MTTLHGTRVDETEVKRAIDDLRGALRPDIRHLFYEVGEDWGGDPTVYVRIVLPNEAAGMENLKRIALPIRDKVYSRLHPERSGLLPYISFRTEKEYLESNDPEWR